MLRITRTKDRVVKTLSKRDGCREEMCVRLNQEDQILPQSNKEVYELVASDMIGKCRESISRNSVEHPADVVYLAQVGKEGA